MKETAMMDQASFGLADSDGDARASPAEIALHMHREALAEFDLDGDSQISREEWNVTRQAPGQGGEHFERLDSDDDGRIAEEEAVLFITEHESFRDAFRRLDRNGDSHLHWEEYSEGEPGSLDVTLFSIDSETEREN